MKLEKIQPHLLRRKISMSDDFNTPTTIFESLSSLSKAIPKVAFELQKIYNPILLFKDISKEGIEWYRPLKANLFLYERIDKYVTLSSEDIYNLTILNLKNVTEVVNSYRNKMIEINNINPVAIVESIAPGMIHWFYIPKSITYLYDFESIFPIFNAFDISDLTYSEFKKDPLLFVNKLNNVFFKKLEA